MKYRNAIVAQLGAKSLMKLEGVSVMVGCLKLPFAIEPIRIVCRVVG